MSTDAMGRSALTDALRGSEQMLRALRKQTDENGLCMLPADAEPDVWVPATLRRRGLAMSGDDAEATLHLVRDDDGLLAWDFGDARAARAAGGRRAARRAVGAGVRGVIEQSFVVRRIAPNAVTAAISGVDTLLNGQWGLRALDANNRFTGPLVRPSGAKKRLLIVHGTFSSTKGMLEKAPATFWAWARANYQEILGFDHPTLSVGPVMNAFDLSQALRDAKGPLDVIAHSRGGLVTRWLLEGFGAGGCAPTRAVLVGAPLMGTSLAAPFKLQKALSLFSNVGVALKGSPDAADKAAGQSYFDTALGLAGVLTSALKTHGASLALDGLVALVPGLLSMARVAGNADIERLAKARAATKPAYFAITSNYVSASPLGSIAALFRPRVWAGKAVDAAIDTLFPGDNDLVVDTQSMTELDDDRASPVNVSVVQRFADEDEVHHLNYFAQAATEQFIRAQLK